MSEPINLTVKANAQDNVTALLYLSEKKNRLGVTIILGHGAGADQSSGFMRLFARGLSDRGLDVMTFNFVYTEQRRGVPDQKAKLESCFRAVIEAALSQKKLKGNKLVIGGKSMGGRIASQVVAAACEQNDPLAKEIGGLVFLGYPLHPPGNPAKLRTEHLPQIKVPMLFVQGTRDSLGSTDEIVPIVKELKLPAEIHVIEGGDHSFKAPKKFGLTQEEVFSGAMDAIVEWVGKHV
ncbi:MAG TPA: alpha/beta family hydrolase [Pyrinomonadaceae bacterium]|jgi:predicted alpha/beta-hydrolase family hydrolase